MTKLEHAARQALQTLERWRDWDDWNNTAAWGLDDENTITALREALAEQAEQEPVAWMVYTADGQSVYVTDNPTDIKVGQRALPLYTTPARAVIAADREKNK